MKLSVELGNQHVRLWQTNQIIINLIVSHFSRIYTSHRHHHHADTIIMTAKDERLCDQFAVFLLLFCSSFFSLVWWIQKPKTVKVVAHAGCLTKMQRKQQQQQRHALNPIMVWIYTYFSLRRYIFYSFFFFIVCVLSIFLVETFRNEKHTRRNERPRWRYCISRTILLL